MATISNSIRAKARDLAHRHENLQAEIDAARDGQKTIMAEAKEAGIDVKSFRRALVLLRKDQGKLAEEEMMISLYREMLT